MKRSDVIIFLTVLVALAAGILFLLSPGTSDWQAYGTVLFPVQTNEPYNPTFVQIQLERISNTLSAPQCLKTLAVVSGVKTGDFRLVGVKPVRSTSMILMMFSGNEGDKVERVASHGSQMIATFYSTNQPTLELKVMDTAVVPPRAVWEQILRR